MVSTLIFLNNSNLPMVGIVQSQKKLFRLFTYSITSECLGLLNAQAKLWINENPPYSLHCKFSEPLVEKPSLATLDHLLVIQTLPSLQHWIQVLQFAPFEVFPPSLSPSPQLSLNTIMTVVVVGLTLIICKIWGVWIVLAPDLTLPFWCLQCWDAMNKVNFVWVIYVNQCNFFLKCKSN